MDIRIPLLVTNKRNEMKLLLVDDYQMVRLGLKSYFELQDDVEVVRSNQWCGRISMALELRPDVIVMDIVMPEVNRIDVNTSYSQRMARNINRDLLPEQ